MKLPANTTIQELGLSSRVINCLQRHNARVQNGMYPAYYNMKEINTLGDILTSQDATLLKIRNLGKGALAEIHKVQQTYTIETQDEDSPRPNFYSNVFNSQRANETLLNLISRATFREILWVMRTIIYDQVSYWSENDHSIIYDQDRPELNIEQANRLQQQLSALLDLYGQSIIDKRIFNEDYLKNYEFARPYIKIIEDLKEQQNDRK